MIEIISLIRNGGKPLTGAERLSLQSGLLEAPLSGPMYDGKPGYMVAASRPSPRILVTHLPIQFLPTQIWEKKPRVRMFVISRGFRMMDRSFYGGLLCMHHRQSDKEVVLWTQGAMDSGLIRYKDGLTNGSYRENVLLREV